MEIPNDMVVAVLISIIMMIASIVLNWGTTGLVCTVLVFFVIVYREKILKYLQDMQEKNKNKAA
jgi:hypothetical protein